ncbi:MAG: PhnD/SsuA/transferrin family substrate-binding protein [Myxococcales bacterium]|nr:PhnD/SsuA/transferrin family substrate-binding protein [Myxococcales bacterium]
MKPSFVHLTGVLCLALGLGCDSTPFPERRVREVAGDSDEARNPGARPPLRVSVAAMLSPRETHSAYSELVMALGRALGERIELVQRRSYREVNDLLLDGHLDVALVCTGGYLELERRAPGAVEVLAVPVSGGGTTYESIVIVPATSPATELDELAGRRFAFTDELSLTGRAYLVHVLQARGEDVASYFGGVLYTRSHDRSVRAVANRMVDGAAVDGLVYDQMVRQMPELHAQTRVIHRSPPLGIPPVVASTRLSGSQRARLRAALLALPGDAGAAAAMERIGIERFVVPPPGLYDDARRIVEAAQ